MKQLTSFGLNENIDKTKTSVTVGKLKIEKCTISEFGIDFGIVFESNAVCLMFTRVLSCNVKP